MTGQVRPAFPLRVPLTCSCDPGFPGCPGRRSDHEAVDGPRGQPSPVRLCQLKPRPSPGSAVFSCLQPWALQPLEGGQFLKGMCFVFFKGSFQLPSPRLSKTNHNHTPPTQIQLDPDSSGREAVAVDLGKEKKKNPHDNKVIGLMSESGLQMSVAKRLHFHFEATSVKGIYLLRRDLL